MSTILEMIVNELFKTHGSQSSFHGPSKTVAHDHQNMAQDNIVMCPCENLYLIVDAFLQHLRIDHKCNECQMTVNNLISQSVVKRKNAINGEDLKKETNIKPYSCDVCNKKFKNTIDLQRHCTAKKHHTYIRETQ
ncbi:10489_t:CDS:1 [Dentiscutata erythropus]|uniref:10489_t:CDS:1 n=1 Tax=Dentiscutata erythropus TaxID=1348616 RepID=A0A9N8WAZ8_9GLOM|nr:10489_t:CDS:1 [Dentiscutata erythropus]